MSATTSDLALQLIAQEKKARTGRLDLGNCGLTQIPPELFDLEWLEWLNLGHGWLDGEEQVWQDSPNTGKRNRFIEIKYTSSYKTSSLAA